MVVIRGDNGSGKSTLLKMLATFHKLKSFVFAT